MKTHFALTRIKKSGSALITALICITALATVAGVMINRMNNGYRAAYHSASWEDAFRAAESGADLAIASLNLSTTSTTWTGWTGNTTTGWTRTFGSTSTPPLPIHEGDGGTKAFATVTVTPSSTSPATTGNRRWWKIRSVGTAEIPGSKFVTEEMSLRTSSNTKNHLSMLRKINYTTDITGGVLRVPQVTRKVEMVAYPTFGKLFQRSLTSKQDITMNGGAYTDSFDSSDPTKSTLSQYDVTKRQSNGDIATNQSGNTSNLNSNPVYGDAMSNGGVIQNTSQVKGSVINNFQTELPDVTIPTWLADGLVYTTSSSALTTGTLAGGTFASPTRFKYTGIDLGSGSNLVLSNPDSTGATPAYIEIWSTGDMKTTAQAAFVIQKGVHVSFFVEGNFSVSGGGVSNLSGTADSMILYGVTPTASPYLRDFKLTGSANFTGVVYAPAFDFVCTGGGDFQGAIVAKTAKVSGNAGYHYDEALGLVDSATTSGYQMALWVEDIQ